MGEFYDIFDYPKYKQIMKEACEKKMQEIVPNFVELSQKVSGAKFVLLPILVKEYHIATFVVGCYTKEQYEHLQDVLGSVISYVKSISDNVYSGVVKEREAERIKMAEILLKEDLKRSQIETEILDRLNSVEDSEENFYAIFDTVGRYLEFNKIVFLFPFFGRRLHCSCHCNRGNNARNTKNQRRCFFDNTFHYHFPFIKVLLKFHIVMFPEKCD